MSKIEIFVLDKLNNTKSEFQIIKPKSYHDFLEKLGKNF